MRLRSGDRRRRRRADPDPPRVLCARVRQARVYAAAGRRIWRGDDFSSRGTAPAPAVRGNHRAHRARGGSHGARMARHAHRRQRHRARGARVAAVHPADPRGPRQGNDGGGAGAQAVHRTQACRSRDRRLRRSRQGLLLHSFPVGANHRVQRAVTGAANRQLLSGAERSGGGERVVSGTPALFHQYVSDLAAGAPVPLHRAQRRNQHAAWQRELDARQAVRAGISVVWGRDQEAVSDHPGGRQRLREFRQRARTADHGRALDRARHGHANS